MSHSNIEETEPLLTDARTPNDPDDEETLRGSSSNFGGTSSEPPQPRTPRTREAPRDHTNFLPLRHGKFTRLETMLAFTCLLLLILMSIFAGGGWIKKSVIPEDKGNYGYFDILYEENQKLLRNILEDDFQSLQVTRLPSPSSSIDKKNFYNLQSFYQSCMDEDRISQLGGAPLVPLLERLFENFPVEDKFSLFNNFGHQNDSFQQAVSLDLLNLTNALSNLSTIGVQPLFAFFVDADAKNPSENALYLTQSGLVLPSKEYYEDEHVMKTYKSVMAELLGRALDNRSNFIIEMGYSKSDNVIDDIYEYSIERVWFKGWEEIVDKIIEFEKALAKISLSPLKIFLLNPSEEFYDPEATYNKHTIRSLEELSPTFYWSYYISSLLPPTVSDPPSKLILTSNQYFENLSILVEKTPPQILQAYLAWQIIAEHANSLDEKFQAPLRRLKAKLRGVDENVKPKRWEVCLRSVDEALGFMAGRYYVLKAFGGHSIDIANQMITSIKEAFVSRLPALNWLDKETRELAVEKVNAIIQKVGYPTKSPNTSDPLSLQDYYRDVKFDQDDYFGNLLSSYLWASDKTWKNVDKPVDRDRILQFPYFSSKAPEYINYGAIGTVIGHELTHGFDNYGRQYDAAGRLIQWWSNDTIENFKGKAKCFVEQYSNYTINGTKGEPVHLNGRLTLGENLADNGGVNVTPCAATQHMSEVSNDLNGEYNNYLLPGFGNLTREQLFFIAFGHSWCSKTRPETAVERVRTDPHSPPAWRVNGVLRNSGNFSEAFKCKLGSKMNPVNKCAL
ncbi:1411_t:CDS:10, partial [Cetraspora pellucida]